MDDELPNTASQTDWRKRAKSPYRKKQLDYKHQRRTGTGGEAWHKVRKRLPRLERQQWRTKMNEATRKSLRDDDAALSVADEVRGMKRSRFRYLHYRRSVSLKQYVEHKQLRRIRSF